jgi:hypothetical protein
VSAFDPRIVGPRLVEFLQACQRHTPFHLAGGAALAGIHLHHRLSADAWLLGQYPVEPLPEMLLPLTSSELRIFRDDLRERFRRRVVPAT